MQLITKVNFEQAMERFENDLAAAKQESPVTNSASHRDGWSFTVYAAATPPGHLIERHYLVDSHNYRIEITETAGEPQGYNRRTVLCLITNQIWETELA